MVINAGEKPLGLAKDVVYGMANLTESDPEILPIYYFNCVEECATRLNKILSNICTVQCQEAEEWSILFG